MSIVELIEQYRNVENIPNRVLYDYLTTSEARATLMKIHGVVRLAEDVRSRIVNDPAFTAGMTPEQRAETIALFFPEYTNPKAVIV